MRSGIVSANGVNAKRPLVSYVGGRFESTCPTYYTSAELRLVNVAPYEEKWILGDSSNLFLRRKAQSQAPS